MKQQSKVQKLIHQMGEKKSLHKFKSIFETMEGIIFGTSIVTHGAPHIKDHIEIKRYMSFAIIGLLPATAAAVYFYGLYALAIIMTSYIAGGIVEVSFAIVREREIEEGFLVTGLIFALVLPPTLPLWAVAIGSIFGTFFGKEIFGGTGRNIFNPALVGRLFITIAFPQLMSACRKYGRSFQSWNYCWWNLSYALQSIQLENPCFIPWNSISIFIYWKYDIPCYSPSCFQHPQRWTLIWSNVYGNRSCYRTNNKNR
jgi:Na+-transporting NADH:ubiquinone oxidoreductase subunit NqrB